MHNIDDDDDDDKGQKKQQGRKTMKSKVHLQELEQEEQIN